MSVWATAEAWQLSIPAPAGKRLSRASIKLVLLALCEHAGPDADNIFPSVATVGQMTGLDPKTVKRALRYLEQLKLVEVVTPATRTRAALRKLGTWHTRPVFEGGGQRPQRGGQRPTLRGGQRPPEPWVNRKEPGFASRSKQNGNGNGSSDERLGRLPDSPPAETSEAEWRARHPELFARAEGRAPPAAVAGRARGRRVAK